MGSFTSSLSPPTAPSPTASAGSYTPTYGHVHQALSILVAGRHLPPEIAIHVLNLAEYHPTLVSISNILPSQSVMIRSSPTGEKVSKVLNVSDELPSWEGAPTEVVSRIKVKTNSRDQGFSSFPEYHGTRQASSSWFELVLLRPDHSTPQTPAAARDSPVSASQSTAEPPPPLPLPIPGAFPSSFVASAPGSPPNPHSQHERGRGKQSYKPVLSTRLHSNIHASQSFSTFELCIPPLTSDVGDAPEEEEEEDAAERTRQRLSLLRAARAGDRIAVTASAQFPAWVNCIKACESMRYRPQLPINQLTRPIRPRPPISPIRFASSSSSSSSSSGPVGDKTRRRIRNAGIAAGAVGALWAYDEYYQASALSRSIRTSIFGVTLALDFKLNFSPDDPEAIDALHERTAKRLAELVEKNRGMYVKLAQALAIQAAILPKPYREVFGGIFDNAPMVPWEEVERVFVNEFGIKPEEAFEVFERKPIASASIAQVHKARLKAQPGEKRTENEGWVAVKIRKEAIPMQLDWDLLCYRTLMWSFEKLFDLPVSFISKYVSEQMRREADLHHEAKNAERTMEFVQGDKMLREKVTVPKVNHEWSGKSVMTAEFVDACRLTDKKRLSAWNLSLKEVMDSATELFSAQVFCWGFVQADPHPGNVLVRPNPSRPSHPQIVLIDHGLYVTLPEAFRQQYCSLWKSLMTGDVKAIEDIATSWGIRRENSNIFASMTLLRPHKVRKTKAEEDGKGGEVGRYDSQVGLKDRLKTMLESEELIPRELIFVTRAMRMMQGNNQALGSPSNRINILAHYASQGLSRSSPPARSLLQIGLKPYLADKFRLAVFKVVLFAVDVGFFVTRVRAWFMERLGGRGEGLEDLLQKQVTDMARKEFGVELDDAAFAG
ncbi:hypothetical protein JCM11641_005348 [Rhodosporidiobolus odoratus]